MTNRSSGIFASIRGRLSVNVMLLGKIGETGDFAVCRYNKILAKIAGWIVGQDYFDYIEKKAVDAGIIFSMDDLNTMRNTANQIRKL